nr:transposase [Candidatus Enterovibrio luxaltus]
MMMTHHQASIFNTIEKVHKDLLILFVKQVQLPLSYPHYSCLNKQVKPIDVTFKTTTQRTIPHLAIDSTGMTVYGKDEW